MRISTMDRECRSVHLAGDIHGEDVRRFYEALGGMGATEGQAIVVDLTEVTSWTVLAQAAFLHAALELAARQCQLLLVGASHELCEQSRGLDVLNRVHQLATRSAPSSVSA